MEQKQTQQEQDGIYYIAQDEILTYREVVERWAQERELLRSVQPYTARKARQKALLFAPWIGNAYVADIDPQSITHGLVTLGKSGGRTNSGLSSATLRAAHMAGTQAVDWAVSKGIASTNAFRQVKRPKAHYRQSKFLTMPQASHLTALMTANLHRFMQEGNVRRTSFALAVLIALATGLRRGEIFALTWDDFDEGVFRISVAKAVKADGRIGTPKTLSGLRSVAVGDSLSALLAEVRSWQNAILPEGSIVSTQCIMCREDGSRASLNAFEHWWRTWADRNNLDGLRFHELRHTHATLLISRGVDVKTVQMRLGHSSAEITMSCYAHAIPLSDGMAAASLDTALFSAE